MVAAVDNTRHEDNVPTLQTDWWNYGGLYVPVSLIEVPEAFIDQYDLHLSRAEASVIEGWVHVTGGQPGAKVEVEIPEIRCKDLRDNGQEGRAADSRRCVRAGALVARDAKALQSQDR